MLMFYVLFGIVVIAKCLSNYLRQHVAWTTCQVSIDLIALVMHILLATRDAGTIKNNSIDFMKLLEVFDPTSLCPDCQIIRSGRSRHCIVCGQCVERYDHHCPWINNCVGIRNHNLFMAYLVV